MPLMFVTLDDLRDFQAKCREEFGLKDDSLTNIDIYIAKAPDNVQYPKCEKCDTDIERLNPDISPVFTLIPVIFSDGTVEFKLQKFFLNKKTSRFCDLQNNDVVTCKCGANDVSEAANREMMRIVKELADEERRRLTGGN